MGLRDWMQRRMAQYDGRAELPAHARLMHAWFTEDRPRPAGEGGFGADGFPAELADTLLRREQVTAELLQMELTTAAGRIEAIPRLQQLLQRYPHPVVYDALILGYADAGRWDHARGVAFAARDRRRECAGSPYAEIRAETDRLRDWTAEDVDELRRERPSPPAE
jgi:hypothetical protein